MNNDSIRKLAERAGSQSRELDLMLLRFSDVLTFDEAAALASGAVALAAQCHEWTQTADAIDKARRERGKP